MSNPIAFSLVIPAYNEEQRLPASLRDIKTFFQAAGPSYEVLVMVERSSDQTLVAAQNEVADTPQIQVIDNLVHRGKGFAVRSGMLRAKGEIVFFMDADLSTPLAEVLAFLAHFSENPEVDVVIGSRALAKSQVLKRQNILRQTLGRGFNFFVQTIAVSGITDTQCGFKAFRKTPAQEIFSRQKIDGFAFDVEVLILAQKLGYKIDVRPVKWFNSAASKVRIWIDPLKMLIDLLKVRFRVAQTLRKNPPPLSNTLSGAKAAAQNQ
jgi:dolichyl-phosphate beta-glucosyltransferase